MLSPSSHSEAGGVAEEQAGPAAAEEGAPGKETPRCGPRPRRSFLEPSSEPPSVEESLRLQRPQPWRAPEVFRLLSYGLGGGGSFGQLPEKSDPSAQPKPRLPNTVAVEEPEAVQRPTVNRAYDLCCSGPKSAIHF